MTTEPPDTDRAAPRRFWLARHHDLSGVSGTGIVAEGTLWSSGQAALHWPGQPTATSLWASLDDLLAVHGHGGWTTVEWIDGNDRHTEHNQCNEHTEHDSSTIEMRRTGEIGVH